LYVSYDLILDYGLSETQYICVFCVYRCLVSN